MTPDILIALALLLGTVVVFATGALRIDLVAILVMIAVAILGLVPIERALGGLSNPAVVTIAGMFVISAGLSRTGVADLVGARILALADGRELRLIVLITLVSGVLSGFVNNIGVVAMMLPVVVEIARKAELPPSKLLIPMALGAQLGGFTTLIGTSPNLLAADALRDAGFEPFGLFGYTPLGIVLLGAGAILLALLGPRLLPTRTPVTRTQGVARPGIREGVELEERLFTLTVPEESLLEGKTLEESLVGSALGIHVLAIERGGKRRLAPGAGTTLRGGDRLLVQGRPDFFLELRGRRHLTPEHGPAPARWLESDDVGVASARVAGDSVLAGKTVSQIDLRAKAGLLILSIRRTGFRRRTHLHDVPLEAGDEVLLQGSRAVISALGKPEGFEQVAFLSGEEAVRTFDLEDRLWSLRITDDSLLAGRKLGDTRLGDAVGMVVLAVGRDEGAIPLPAADTELRPGDHLLVKTRPDDLVVLRGLQRLTFELDPVIHPEDLESDEAGFVEVVLAPRSALIGKSIREVNFRRRFEMHVTAIVREGEVLRANLRDERLRFGDALLLYGPRKKERSLAGEPDFILLREPAAAPPEIRLAPRSLVILALALGGVLTGLVPVAVGVLSGALLMVLTRCLTPEEAYRAVDWPTLVLVAGMLALGAALGDTGTAALLGEGVLGVTASFGPTGVLAALVLVTAVGAQILPAPAVVVLMAPIAITGAAQLGVSPHPFVMGIAIASTSLASPVSQPAHALVMAPAGYRMADYLRLGVPMTVLVLALTILLLPFIFPF